ncbi:hypothetical protein BKA82DRAFT_4020201 [Pisolithus tinctorius]|nr:hypothetical protein BKA82DRAFT_4020201 [Pisolithus tinctorius]
MHLWHGTGTSAGTASTALVLCRNTLQWCQNGLNDGRMALLEHKVPLWYLTTYSLSSLFTTKVAYRYFYRHWGCAGTNYKELVPGQPPWHWGCAGTHYKGARMDCMMDPWHWGYAGIHGTGAGPASMALVRCRYTLQWCWDGLHDGPWHWSSAGTHYNGAGRPA